jgi:hypothetical protein
VGVLRRAAVLFAGALAVSCAPARPPATGAYAAAARVACGDADLVKRELISYRKRDLTRVQVAAALEAAARRIDEQAQTTSGGWRLHDLAASFRVMRKTIVGRGDQGVASADARVTRAEAGCDIVSAAR